MEEVGFRIQDSEIEEQNSAGDLAAVLAPPVTRAPLTRVLAILLALLSVPFAGRAANTAPIEGRVYDPSGNPIPHVRVSLLRSSVSVRLRAL